MELPFWSNIKPILEITILWVVFYQILVFFEGTRAFQVLKGLTYLLIAFLICQILKLDTINWLLTKFFALSVIALLIIFQQELRHGLARLGQQHIFAIGLEESEMLAILEEISDSVFKIVKKKAGCLLAIEREAKLKTYIESGIPVDAKVSSEMIQSLFVTSSPLHDGGIIIKGDRIIAASCLFPLTDNPNFSKVLGTRHRAALGLSEQSDCIVIMASEQTGEVSVALEGRFITIVDESRLFNLLCDLLIAPSPKRKNEKMAKQ
ncbi:MAG: TIGR00159 family protein [Omnitrophica WOR_2 bacterium GWA2_47_8]|nr:MAG: TIGR00159 family protein [Omnitrophica WOR_2 bacterium GWA2_47_8]